MSVNSTGANETAAVDLMSQLIVNGVDIVLVGGGNSVSYTDTDVEGTYNTRTKSVSEADLTISTPSGFGGTTDLIIDVQVTFNSVDIGTVSDVVIQNQSNNDRFVLANEVNNPDTSGQTVTLPSGTTLFSFGNP